MANKGVAFFGALLTGVGGLSLGYASGYASAISQIASVIASAAGAIPLLGSSLASEISTYVQQQVFNDVSTISRYRNCPHHNWIHLTVLGARSAQMGSYENEM